MNNLDKIIIDSYNEQIKNLDYPFDRAESVLDVYNGTPLASGIAFGSAMVSLGVCSDEFQFLTVGGSSYGKITLNGEAIEVRLADHGNQSALHSSSPINIAPNRDGLQEVVDAIEGGNYKVFYVDDDNNECSEDDADCCYIEILGSKRKVW